MGRGIAVLAVSSNMRVACRWVEDIGAFSKHKRLACRREGG